MKTLAPILFSLVLFTSCSNQNIDEPVKDLTPYENAIYISSSSTDLPYNAYGKAMLGAETDLKGDVTSHTVFYANGVQLQSNEFIPSDTGVYVIQGIYKDLESEPLEVRVTPARNKKVLIEYFTSRTCGWCPWIGSRLDSLDKANEQVISYSIHGEDEMHIPETNLLQEYLHVFERPSVRTNRGYVRHASTPTENVRLADTVSYLLSRQPAAELAIVSQWNENLLTIDVSGKFYSLLPEPVYLTILIVEDSIVSYNQYNYFSGSSLQGCPYTSLPNPIPEYQNHNVLRRVLSDIKGDLLDLSGLVLQQSRPIGTYSFDIPEWIAREDTFVIAILHTRRDDISISSVLNAQAVEAGTTVSFED